MQDGQKHDGSVFNQNIDGCLESAIGKYGLSRSQYESWLTRAGPHVEALKDDYRNNRLALLRIAEDVSDIAEAEAALARLSVGANTLVFFGTGGSEPRRANAGADRRLENSRRRPVRRSGPGRARASTTISMAARSKAY